jgi:hypothetical protein
VRAHTSGDSRRRIAHVSRELLPGVEDEHDAGVENEHGRGVILLVSVFMVPVSCSWCRSMVFMVPPAEGHTDPGKQLMISRIGRV